MRPAPCFPPGCEEPPRLQQFLVRAGNRCLSWTIEVRPGVGARLLGGGSARQLLHAGPRKENV